MSRALITFATGPCEELLEIALPSMEEFADRHGYEFLVADIGDSRPPSWMKVPALLTALEHFDEALFMDADMVIVDPSEDLQVPDSAWQAMVAHHTNDGEVPNCGLWLVREPMREVLHAAWAMTGYVNHPWWEQAAVVELMGYGGQPLVLAHPTDLYQATHFLGSEWNDHRDDQNRAAHPRIRHATMWPDRAQVMREWAAEALLVAA